MGDKSPKSKKRDQKQKGAVKDQQVKHAKAKQAAQGGAAAPAKGKK